MRIYRARFKILYVVVAWLIYWLIGRAIGVAGVPALINSVWGCISLLAVFWIGSRMFRVDGEPAAPRPWWKMTGRRPLSTVLGVLFAIGAAIYTLIFCLYPVIALGAESAIEIRIAGLVGLPLPFAILAVLYLYSGARLRRLEPPAAEAAAPETGVRSARPDPIAEEERVWREIESGEDDDQRA